MRSKWMVLAVVLAIVALLLGGACGEKSKKAASDPDFTDDQPGGGDDDASGDDDDDDDTTDDDTADDDTADEEIRVAYIYNYNTDAPGDFADLLTDQNIKIVAVAEDAVAATDFAAVDMIMVDSQTDWFSLAAAQAIADSGKKVLGFFEGGGTLFDELGMSVGWSGGYTDFDVTDAIVYSPDDNIFNEPFNLAVEAYDSLQILASGVDLRYQDVYVAPSGVAVLAGRPDISTGWSAITLEDSTYMYWGYDVAAGNLTDLGVRLLVNCVYRLGK